ncbi:tetratricopeptide repeat protein [Nostoc sp. DedQUE09]|uniref:tetratricopeptide repeat protein n=1 Tax=Nostoc sp. DedQUE09 TaxID=3075394 RepID=UPI002AD4A4CE|nr:tetratricopeptide repeat protein [Nostoc sp. DedQUE09]MDZ7952498.1 tetratricopeptide repeat protein [Nostoc sp. DedQUE09]
MPPEDSLLESKTRANQLLLEGTTSFDNKDYEAAIALYQQAIEIFRELQLKRDEGLVLNAIGLSYYYLSSYTKAKQSLEESLTIFRAEDSRDIQQEGRVLNNLGILYDATEDFAQAKESYELALKIFEETEDQVEQAKVINNSSYSQYLQQDYKSAYEKLPMAFNIFREANAQPGLEIVRRNLINTAMRLVEEKPDKGDGNHDKSPPPPFEK